MVKVLVSSLFSLRHPVSHFESIPILKVLHMEYAHARAHAVMEVTQICPKPNLKLTHFDSYPCSGACAPVTFETFTIGLLSKCHTGLSKISFLNPVISVISAVLRESVSLFLIRWVKRSQWNLKY